jgi:hypothetical protein
MRHRFHSLCPYFAMFPESFAEDWISRLTRRGDVVLDPFCGRGTAPFQALLMERKSVGCDVNPVAYCITRAKTNAPSIASVRRRLTILDHQFRPVDWVSSVEAMPEFFRLAFSRGTLGQLLYLRSQLRWHRSDTDCMIAALVLGSLHGESHRSPWYLSNQMPRTISTKPAYSVRFWKERGLLPPERDAFEVIRGRLAYRYESDPAPRGQVLVSQLDMRDLPRLVGLPEKIKCVITSPPYLDVTNFEEDQWLRLWFLGNSPHPTYQRISQDDRHERPERYWGFIGDMWRSLGLVLARNANIVIRIGACGVAPERVVEMLSACTAFAKRKVTLVSHSVSELRRRQTDSFRPGSKGCRFEADCHYCMH